MLMATENMHADNPLVLQEQDEKRKSLFTLGDFVRCATFIVVGTFLIVSSTMIPQTKQYSPNPPAETESTPVHIAENVNQLGGAFQAGTEEYEYEEVLTTVRYQPSETVFIGGPRVQSLGENILTDTQFLTTDIDNLQWLEDEAEFMLEENTSHKLCIVSVGLNELSKAMNYAQLLNSWPAKFPEVSFVFVNLGPVDESLYAGATNAKIQNYNNSMKALLNDNWRFVDLYGYLAENGIEAEDGLNYSESLNKTLFAWILQQADTEEKIEYVPIIPEGSSN